MNEQKLPGCVEAIRDMAPRSTGVDINWADAHMLGALIDTFFEHPERIEITNMQEFRCELCNAPAWLAHRLPTAGGVLKVCRSCDVSVGGDLRRHHESAQEQANEQAVDCE